MLKRILPTVSVKGDNLNGIGGDRLARYRNRTGGFIPRTFHAARTAGR